MPKYNGQKSTFDRKVYRVHFLTNMIVGDLVSFRGPFFVKSNLECLTCSLYVSKPKKLGLKIRATVFGRFWANFRAKNKNTNF